MLPPRKLLLLQNQLKICLKVKKTKLMKRKWSRIQIQ